jgi:hypothetical protein
MLDRIEMVKPSYVLSRTKCIPVEDTTKYANRTGTRVCAVSALLVERGYTIKHSPGKITKYDSDGEKVNGMMIDLVTKEYGITYKQYGHIINAFHKGKNFKDTAKILKAKGL